MTSHIITWQELCDNILRALDDHRKEIAVSYHCIIMPSQHFHMMQAPWGEAGFGIDSVAIKGSLQEFICYIKATDALHKYVGWLLDDVLEQL
jgi:hypothetical protein